MVANRVRRLTFLLVLTCAAAGGCRSVREIKWDLSAREDEPQRPALGYHEEYDHDYYRDVSEQRARNEAEFLARNPGARR